jgi:hypothetical protein
MFTMSRVTHHFQAQSQPITPLLTFIGINKDGVRRFSMLLEVEVLLYENFCLLIYLFLCFVCVCVCVCVYL